MKIWRLKFLELLLLLVALPSLPISLGHSCSEPELHRSKLPIAAALERQILVDAESLSDAKSSTDGEENSALGWMGADRFGLYTFRAVADSVRENHFFLSVLQRCGRLCSLSPPFLS